MREWIEQELATVELADARLDKRLALMLDRFSQKPGLSIPAACEGWSETKAAYEFFNNERVTPSEVLAPHRNATIERVAAERVVLAVQDTTEIDLTRKKEQVGGPLGDELHWGIHLHPLWVVTPSRIPLGTVHAEMWARDLEDFRKRSERHNKSIEEKESFRWLLGYRQACALASEAPDTQVVCISDSEGDIYECFVAGILSEGCRKADWIVRACQDRRLVDSEHKKLRCEIEKQPVLKELTVEVSPREAKGGETRRRHQARKARTATVVVRSATVTLKAPQRPSENKLPDVQVNVVLVREENPPDGEEAIEWLLVTSLPIDREEAVQQVIDYYCARWEIEILFRVLKSGCAIEKRQFESTEATENCVALYLIVAWRVLFVLKLGREVPDLPCDSVLSTEEWRSVYTIVNKQPPPKKVPTLGEMVPLIASLGGYLRRKHDGPPGPKAMWIGMQRMRDFAIAWSAFGPPIVPRCV